MPPPSAERSAQALTVRDAAVLGIGSMIGAGIFALLGEAGAVAGAAVWISFLIGGIVAGLLGYVCAKLGMRFPSSGGLITYLIEGFGKGRLVGVACWLGYIAAIVIVGAMVAVSFGGYATALFVGEHAGGAWDNVFITVLILGMLAVNLVGAQFVANAQSLIVAGVLAVFAVFIVVTIVNINPDLLAFSSYPSLSKILASVALTFFAYLGFNVITFTAGDLRDPSHDLPRAMTFALGTTSLVYVLIAIGVFGTLTTTQVIGYGETAIAEAARPTLGDAGFTIMAIVALLSTAGCTNATLYASGNLTDQLAKAELFPEFFGETSRLGRHAGLLITSALVLIIANLVDLSAIASVGSAVSLMVFLFVGLAGWRRRADTNSSPAIVGLAIVVIAVVLGFFAVDTLQTAPETFTAIVLLGLLAIALDALVRRSRHSTVAPERMASPPVTTARVPPPVTSFVAVAFESATAAENALATVRDLDAEPGVSVRDAAIVVRTEAGRIELEQTREIAPGDAVVGGGSAGLVAGVLLGLPVGGALLGLAGGAVFGLRDTGIPDSRLRQLGKDLAPGHAVLCVLVDAEVGMPRVRDALRRYGTVFDAALSSDADP